MTAQRMRFSPYCQSVPISANPAARSAATCCISSTDSEPWWSSLSLRRARSAAGPASSGAAVAASHQAFQSSWCSRPPSRRWARALADGVPEAGQGGHRRLVLLQVVAVEHQPAGAQHGRQFRVHGPQLGPVQPVQRGGAHRRVRGTVQAQRRRPAGFPQVLVHEAKPGTAAIRSAAEGQQQRIGIDGHHARRGHPVEQPDREGAGAAAQVEHERVVPAHPGLDRVDEYGEPLLAVGHVPLLLGVPAADPPLGPVQVHNRPLPSGPGEHRDRQSQT